LRNSLPEGIIVTVHRINKNTRKNRCKGWYRKRREKIGLISYSYKIEVPESEWEKTPNSVKGRMEKMRQLIQELEEKWDRISQNPSSSSSPPSTDATSVERKRRQDKRAIEKQRRTTKTQGILASAVREI